MKKLTIILLILFLFAGLYSADQWFTHTFRLYLTSPIENQYVMFYNDNGVLRLINTSDIVVLGDLYLPNGGYIYGRNNADTAWDGIGTYNTSDRWQWDVEQERGNAYWGDNAGTVTTDYMTISGTNSATNGFNLQIGGYNMLTITRDGDGAGDSDTPKVTIGTTSHFSVTTTLTATQVNALKATPLEVVQTYGANTWIELESVFITYDYGSAAFTVAADEDLVIEWADGTDATASIETTGFLDQADDEIRWYPIVITAGADPEASLNQKLQIFNTGAGETADGTGCEVDIRITYIVYETGF